MNFTELTLPTTISKLQIFGTPIFANFNFPVCSAMYSNSVLGTYLLSLVIVFTNQNEQNKLCIYIRLHIGYGPILIFVAPPCEGPSIKDVGNLERERGQNSLEQKEKNTNIGVKKSLKVPTSFMDAIPNIKYARHHLLAWKPYISTPCTFTMYIAEVLVTRFQSFTLYAFSAIFILKYVLCSRTLLNFQATIFFRFTIRLMQTSQILLIFMS